MAQRKDDDHTTQTKGDNNDIRQWPWQAQFAALLFALMIAVFLIVLPVLVVRVLDAQYAFSSESDLWAAMIAILLGLTTMTVSGIFVFMTFRIERGARLEARSTAEEAMDKYAKNVVNDMETKLNEQFGNSRKKIDRRFVRVLDEMSKLVGGLKRMQGQVDHGTQNIQNEMSTLVDGVKKAQDQVGEGQQSIQREVSTLVDGLREVQRQVEQARQNIQNEFGNDAEPPDDDGAGDPNNE